MLSFTKISVLLSFLFGACPAKSLVTWLLLLWCCKHDRSVFSIFPLTDSHRFGCVCVDGCCVYVPNAQPASQCGRESREPKCWKWNEHSTDCQFCVCLLFWMAGIRGDTRALPPKILHWHCPTVIIETTFEQSHFQGHTRTLSDAFTRSSLSHSRHRWCNHKYCHSYRPHVIHFHIHSDRRHLLALASIILQHS